MRIVEKEMEAAIPVGFITWRVMGDLVSGLMIARVTTWVLGVINLFSKSSRPSKYGLGLETPKKWSGQRS